MCKFFVYKMFFFLAHELQLKSPSLLNMRLRTNVTCICSSLFHVECSGALGMVSRGIKTNQLSASSSVSLLYSPGMARLNSSSAWCANNAQQDQFIQVCHTERPLRRCCDN